MTQLRWDFSGERVGAESESLQLNQPTEFAGNFAGKLIVFEVEDGEGGE